MWEGGRETGGGRGEGGTRLKGDTSSCPSSLSVVDFAQGNKFHTQYANVADFYTVCTNLFSPSSSLNAPLSFSLDPILEYTCLNPDQTVAQSQGIPAWRQNSVTKRTLKLYQIPIVLIATIY